MKRTHLLLAALPAALLLVPWASAQERKTETKTETKTEIRNEDGKLVGEEKTTMRKEMNEHEARATFQKTWMMPATRAQKASDIMGKPVRNNANERLGECGELAIDPDAGRIVYAVVEFGGLLGVGEKWFAVPWSALKLGDDAKFLGMDATKDSLKNAYGFDKKAQWPNFADERWATETHKFYNQPRYWEMSDDTTGVYRTTTRWQKASDLIGKMVHSRANNDMLGKVENLIIDPDTGRVMYALVQFSKVPGLSGEHAVPWRALDLNNEYTHFMIDMDKEQLKASKAFDKSANMTDRTWASDNARFWNVKAYWEREADGDMKLKMERKTP